MSKINLELDFDAILFRIEQDKKGIKPAAWADMLGVTRNIVTNVHGKIKQKPSLEYIVAVSKATGRSVDYYLWGKEDKIQPAQEGSSKITKVIIEHQDIIRKFKNPEIAKAMNEKLLDIEAADEEIFRRTDAYIQGVHDAIKSPKKKKSKRSTG